MVFLFKKREAPNYQRPKVSQRFDGYPDRSTKLPDRTPKVTDRKRKSLDRTSRYAKVSNLKMNSLKYLTISLTIGIVLL